MSDELPLPPPRRDEPADPEPRPDPLPPPAPVSTPPPPPIPTPSRDRKAAAPSSSRLDRWTLVGALGMLAGALLPQVGRLSFLEPDMEHELVWVWDHLEQALSFGDGYSGMWWAALMLLPIAVGTAMIVVLRGGREPVRSWLLIGIPFVAWAVRSAPRWDWTSASTFGEINVGYGLPLLAIATGAATALLEPGNRPGIRATVGFCGVALLLTLLAPGFQEGPMLLLPFDEVTWDEFWVVGVSVLVNIGFVALALSVFRAKPDVSGTARLLVITAGAFMVGLPLAQVFDRSPVSVMDLFNGAKLVCAQCGPFLLAAAAVRRFIDLVSATDDEMPDVYA